MRITPEETRRIAALAHLELSDSELAQMSSELSLILDYIDQLKEVDISGVGERHAAVATPLAVDERHPSLRQDTVSHNAPQFVHGHFVVPKIIGGES